MHTYASTRTLLICISIESKLCKCKHVSKGHCQEQWFVAPLCEPGLGLCPLWLLTSCVDVTAVSSLGLFSFPSSHGVGEGAEARKCQAVEEEPEGPLRACPSAPGFTLKEKSGVRPNDRPLVFSQLTGSVCCRWDLGRTSACMPWRKG